LIRVLVPPRAVQVVRCKCNHRFSRGAERLYAGACGGYDLGSDIFCGEDIRQDEPRVRKVSEVRWKSQLETVERTVTFITDTCRKHI